jgi:hypothetical protein
MKEIFTKWINETELIGEKGMDYIYDKFNFNEFKKSLNNKDYKNYVNILIGFFEKNTKIKDQWKKFIKNYNYKKLKIYNENQNLFEQIFNNSKSGYVELAYNYPVIFRYFLLNYVIPSYVVQNAGANLDKNLIYRLLNDKRSNEIKNYIYSVCKQLNTFITDYQIPKYNINEIFDILNNDPNLFYTLDEQINNIFELMKNNNLWKSYLQDENNKKFIKNELNILLVDCLYNVLENKFKNINTMIAKKFEDCKATTPNMISNKSSTNFIEDNENKINLLIEEINNIFRNESTYNLTNNLLNIVKNKIGKLLPINYTEDDLLPLLIWILIKSNIKNLFFKIWITQLFEEFKKDNKIINSFIAAIIYICNLQEKGNSKCIYMEQTNKNNTNNSRSESNSIQGRNVIINQKNNVKIVQPNPENEFPNLDLKGSTFLQKFIQEVIEKNNRENPDIFVIFLQESNMSSGYSDRLIQSLFHELNYDTYAILGQKVLYDMYRSRDSRLASKAKSIGKGRLGTGYEKGQRIGIFIRENIILDDISKLSIYKKNKYKNCDDNQGLKVNISNNNKNLTYSRINNNELKQNIFFSCTNEPLQYKTNIIGEHKSKSIASAFFIAEKNNISYPIFLLDLHLPMERKSKNGNYGNSIRNQVFENILKLYDLNYSAITFIGGDFNYRLKPLGGVDEKGNPTPNPDFFSNKFDEYSKLVNINYRYKNTAFNSSYYGSIITDPLNKSKNSEFIYSFTEGSYPNPSCALKQEQHINSYNGKKIYKTSRQPGFCDRIIYREFCRAELIPNQNSQYYYVDNIAYWTPDYHQFWFSDHSPVAGIFKINQINQENYKKI